MKKKILSVLFVIISIVLLIISYNFVVHIITFSNHREYFKKPIEDQTIKPWMSINYIKKIYWIDLEELYWNEIWIWNRNKTLDNYCEKYELNCTEFIITLEEYKNGN